MAIQIRTSLDDVDLDKAFVPHRPERPAKTEGGKLFKIVSDYEPSGDQPTAIAELAEQAGAGERDQVLLGVTGSGKTFTMAKVVEQLQRPALVETPIFPGPGDCAASLALPASRERGFGLALCSEGETVMHLMYFTEQPMSAYDAQKGWISAPLR